MHVYNVIQAAKYIGCDPKTVRRWLKRGELTAERTSRGWLAIPGGQVEYAKIKWEEEQAQFARPSLPKDSLDSKESREALDSIWRLEERIVVLEQAVAAQNKKIASLEEALSNVSLVVPSFPQDHPQPQQSLYRFSVDREDTQPQQSPQNRNVAPSETDMLSARDFADQLGLEYTVLDGYIRRGVRGEKMDVTEVPTSRKGYSNRYFTPEQQKRATELLRKHKKID